MNEFYLTAPPFHSKQDENKIAHIFHVNPSCGYNNAYASYIPAVIAIKVAKITGALMVENCLL